MNRHAWPTVAQTVLLVSFLRQGHVLGQNSAASETLFQRGLAQMMQGNYASACPSLRESYALEPLGGTKFTLAECEAKWGNVATAIAHYSDYLGIVDTMPAEQRQRHAERVKVAQAQLGALRARVPLLTLRLPESAPNGTIVIRDGVVLSRVSLGIATPLDPGEHVIVTQVPSGAKREVVIELASGERRQLDLEVAVSDARKGSTPPPDSTDVAPPDQGAKPLGTSHTWSYVAGGVGVAGIAVGTVTGIMSLKKKQIVDDNCNGAECNTKGFDAADSGRTLGTVSTISIGVGLAGLVAGGVLWLAAPKAHVSERGQQAWVPVLSGDGRSSALVGLRGTW